MKKREYNSCQKEPIKAALDKMRDEASKSATNGLLCDKKASELFLESATPFDNGCTKVLDIESVIDEIRKSDCGAWLKDCDGRLFKCSDGREKRMELARLLNKLYKTAGV